MENSTRIPFSIVTVWQICMSVYTHTGLGLHPMVIFSDLATQIETSVSQPIRSENDDLMSGWVLYLMLDITTLPLPVSLLLLHNLLGYRGPTTVKPALCLDSTPEAWGPGWSQPGTTLIGGGIPLMPSPINSPEPSMMSGEAGWTVRGTHLHHTLGTSQVWALLRYGSKWHYRQNRIIFFNRLIHKSY